MRMSQGILLLFLMLAITTGCASKPSQYAQKGYESNPEWSMARNVTEAAGLEEVMDVSVEALTQGGSYLKPVPESKGTIEKGAWLTTAALSDFSTMSFLTMPGLTNWNAAGNADHRGESRLFAWMPRDLAETPEEAIQKLEGIIKDAIRKGMTETSFPEPFYVPSLPPGAPYSTFLAHGKYKHYGYPVKGGVCDEGELFCRYHMAFPKTTIEGDPTIVPGIAPDFLGSSDAWVFSRLSTFEPSRVILQLNTFPDVEVWKNTTKYLPEWAFLYIAPLTAHVEGKLNLVPVMLHQGEAHYFVEPDRG